jgi:hypothetical protein
MDSASIIIYGNLLILAPITFHINFEMKDLPFQIGHILPARTQIILSVNILSAPKPHGDHQYKGWISMACKQASANP